MFAEALAIVVHMIMNNHVYVFDDEIILQQNEGSIGLRITGLLAEIVMILWCKTFSEKLKELKIENDLLPRFVDDITLAPTIIPEGTRLIDGKLTHMENLVETDKHIPGDKRTMDIIQEVANNICKELL